MKTLKKLQVNSDKLLKNEELIALKGGTNCFCLRTNDGSFCASGTATSASECLEMCHAACSTGTYIFTGY